MPTTVSAPQSTTCSAALGQWRPTGRSPRSTHDCAVLAPQPIFAGSSPRYVASRAQLDAVHFPCSLLPPASFPPIDAANGILIWTVTAFEYVIAIFFETEIAIFFETEIAIFFFETEIAIFVCGHVFATVTFFCRV